MRKSFCYEMHDVRVRIRARYPLINRRLRASTDKKDPRSVPWGLPRVKCVARGACRLRRSVGDARAKVRGSRLAPPMSRGRFCIVACRRPGVRFRFYTPPHILQRAYRETLRGFPSLRRIPPSSRERASGSRNNWGLCCRVGTNDPMGPSPVPARKQ